MTEETQGPSKGPGQPSEPEIRLRAATPEDAATMAHVFQIAFAPVAAQLGYRPSPMDRSFHAALETRMALAAQRPGDREPIGFAALAPSPTQLYVDAIAVAPEAQGAGVGRALLGGIEALASELCLDRVRLDTDPALTRQVRFYVSAGYRPLRRFSAGSAHRLRLSKSVVTALDLLLARSGEQRAAER